MGKQRDEIMERARNLPRVRDLAGSRLLIQKGQGARLFDVDNVGYVDFTGGGGSAIVGYANQYISDAVKKALTNGIPAGFHPPAEVDLAESLQQFVPWVDSWFFFRDEDDAFGRALKWAQSRTGRSQFLIPGSIRSQSASTCGNDCRFIPGWNIENIEVALVGGAKKIAALIVDPLMSGLGVIPAPDGALVQIAELCRDAGVLLILDERVTGLRLARGGASERFGVTPDAVIMGGALGGGLPIGALGIAGLDPASDGPPWEDQETLPHPVALRAADAVLSILKNDSVFERLEERCLQLVEGMTALIERFSRPLKVNQLGSLFAIYASRDDVTNRAGAEASDTEAYARLVSALREEGVLFPPEALTPAFVSSAHGAKDIEETLGAFERVLLRLHQEDLP
jgi:glutamate-1-semialdehyde 2,1-aminomutase